MTRRAMRAVPVMQEEIFAAQRRNAGSFKILLVKYLSDASVDAVALFCGYHEHRPAPK